MDRVVCFGEALIDFAPAAQAHGAAPRMFVQHAGGAPANVAVAVARLGGDAEFIGMLGTDTFGDFLLQSLRDSGVGTRYVKRTHEAPTALAIVALDARGERSFSFYRPPAADLLFRDRDFPDVAFRDTHIFHVCSNSMTEVAIADTTFNTMQRARDAGVLVSFDMNLRPALWPRDSDPMPRLWRALMLADVVKLSREEFEFLVGSGGGETGVLQRLWRAKCRLLVITDGARPLRWLTPAAGGTLDSFSIITVDSTAAGDAFTGGLLYAMAARRVDRETLPAFTADTGALLDVLRFAAACGAWAATQHGAFSAMPSREDVERMIKRATADAGAGPDPHAVDLSR
jgi:fructokinase